MAEPVLVVHGGAGAIGALEPARERAAREGLAEALRSGYAQLSAGADAVAAVVAAVAVLEDCPEFNAGRGSVLSSDGSVELSAAVMRGSDAAAGAIAGVSDLRNPVRAALAVLEHCEAVLLIGEGASAFARAHGAEPATREWLATEARIAQLARASGGAALDHGTVGAVAQDRAGGLAAATSTGGLTNQLPGRVGDSPLIGAGTWANDATVALSATGQGEFFIRAAFAKEVDAQLRYAQVELEDACRRALDDVTQLGGSGGCIAVSASGEIALPFTTRGMYRGWIRAEGEPHVAVFADEPL